MSPTSIVDREIDHFNQLAATWWDESGPMWPLHRLNALRVPFIERHLRDHFGSLKGLSVLDVGCGAGILSESLARRGAHITGVDAAEKNIAIAKQHAESEGLSIDYRATTVEQLDPTAKFDVVLNMEVVEHVNDVSAFMKDCADRVKPGGMTFVATINRTPYSFVTAIVGAEYILRWLPKGTHHWSQFVTPAETLAFLRRDGFQVRETTGVGVNPLAKSLFLTSNTGANYMLAAART